MTQNTPICPKEFGQTMYHKGLRGLTLTRSELEFSSPYDVSERDLLNINLTTSTQIKYFIRIQNLKYLIKIYPFPGSYKMTFMECILLAMKKHSDGLIFITGFLVGLFFCVACYTQLFAGSEIKMRAKLLHDLLHIPAEQRSARVLDLCFFAVANALDQEMNIISHEELPKPGDFNTMELLQHLEDRIEESAKGVNTGIEIGSRGFVPLTQYERITFVEAMKKKNKEWTVAAFENGGENHFLGVNCSTGFEKKIKCVKDWIEEKKKEKFGDV
ncbi:90c04c9a-802d-4ded-b2b6-738948fc4665 [Sclerotinia trifoliorum]|uniref:90c04c9a-802d-4ded-b2b6-738948fc4665 n=1 Tax=Sclerotinia trifoliorum TaxID=28548 RepID=A0A8H2ZLF1_9HELO|nr:90c04c9a-802d-4ded-b2b6-738948fc4665 [Sclerotinia trifoliorum]